MLQHAPRIALRRYSSARTTRELNIPAAQIAFAQTHTKRDADGSRNAYNSCASEVKDVKPPSRGIYARTSMTSGQTHYDVYSFLKAGTLQPSRNTKSRGKSSSNARNRSKKPELFSTSPDVNSLAPYEMSPSFRGGNSEMSWISDDDLRGLLRSVITMPLKRRENKLLHPITPEELHLRLLQAMTYTPIPRLGPLIKYHNIYPKLQSAPSYNFLVQLAIRHKSYVVAFRLQQQMEETGIVPDSESKLLNVRLLVRVGRWDRAWLFVRRQLSTISSQDPLPLLLEMLGHCKILEFRITPPSSGRLDPNKKSSISANPSGINGRGTNLQALQEDILEDIPTYLPSDIHPPPHFILIVVRHLLQISQMDTARAVTLEWISYLPKLLSKARKRRCLHLLHLHLGYSRKNFAAHISSRQFAKLFFEQQPRLRPTSSTLFLLLRSLLRAKGALTYEALRLVYSFRKSWGHSIIDRRVRRCIVTIALREGRLNVARKWLKVEDRAAAPEKLMAIQREVVGVPLIKPPKRIRRVPSIQMMPEIHYENRKWRWARRRLWRVERIKPHSKQEGSPKQQEGSHVSGGI